MAMDHRRQRVSNEVRMCASVCQILPPLPLPHYVPLLRCVPSCLQATRHQSPRVLVYDKRRVISSVSQDQEAILKQTSSQNDKYSASIKCVCLLYAFMEVFLMLSRYSLVLLVRLKTDKVGVILCFSFVHLCINVCLLVTKIRYYF